MKLPVMPPVEPMLARLAGEIPVGDFQYEPKWDGFRAIVFRDGDEIFIQSRRSRPLNRYFPELEQALARELSPRIVVDGEIVIVGAQGLDFEALLMRIHPAASRVARLAKEAPSHFVAFDVLALDNASLLDTPLAARRARLEEALGGVGPSVHLTPATNDAKLAGKWFKRFEGAGLDGVVAKPLDLTYVPGERVMTKVKHQRTADCVVGGYRTGKNDDGVASLLLGLYDGDKQLHSVGVATGFTAKARRELLTKLQPLTEGARTDHPWLEADIEEGVRIPGEPSRWSGDRDLAWHALRPELVVEVAYDHLQGTRFRHATHFVRWRPDRDPLTCTYDQLEVVPPADLASILGGTAGEIGGHET